jgi:hypothetical protein
MRLPFEKTGPLLAALLVAASAAAGPVYKWVDPAGRFHFSDMPQPGWKRVDLRSANQASSAIPQNSTAADTQRAADCQQQQDALTAYRKAGKVIERDALGNEHEFSEEQKLQLIARAEQQVEDACVGEASSDRSIK